MTVSLDDMIALSLTMAQGQTSGDGILNHHLLLLILQNLGGKPRAGQRQSIQEHMTSYSCVPVADIKRS